MSRSDILLKVLVLSSLLILLLYGCSTDHRVKIYEGKILLESYEIDSDSLRHGITEKYYTSGSTFEKSHYEHGKLHGERLIYYESGAIEIRENYCMNMFCDTLITYFENGNRKFVGVYNHGILSGMVTVYYESGELKEEVNFLDNEENGPFTEYHKNGQVMWKGEYRKGPNEYGELTEYDKNGEKVKLMECDTLAICRTVWERG